MLFAEFGICGVYGGYGTAKVRDVRRIEGRRGLRGGLNQERIGCFMDNLRAFDVNTDQ